MDQRDWKVLGGAAIAALVIGGVQLALRTPPIPQQVVVPPEWPPGLEPYTGKLDSEVDQRAYRLCLLEHMPGASNDAVALQIAATCLNADDGDAPSPRFANGRACMLTRGRQTTSTLASRYIQSACFSLYGAAR